MKELVEHITEALKINSKSKVNTKYHPKDKDELMKLLDKLIEERGYDADLNDIDVSQITDMSFLFSSGKLLNFDGNISDWDISNVTNMYYMFYGSNFNGDISKWNVSNVKNMYKMFTRSKFNGDLSNWDVSNVKDMGLMFRFCPLEKNPPKWYHI